MPADSSTDSLRLGGGAAMRGIKSIPPLFQRP